MSVGDQALLDAASMLGTALGQMLRGDPQRAAQLAAEARERSIEADRLAKEAERKRQENFARIRGLLKLDSFDGESGGGLVLKGVSVPGSGGLDLKLDHAVSGGGLDLKLDDDDLKPRGTQAVANTPGGWAPNTDPMVVDLRNFQRAAYLTALPDPSGEAIAAAAQGDMAVIGMPPAGDMPVLNGEGLRQFQEANNAYHESHHDGMKAAEYFNRAQAQRDIARRELRAMRAELERELANESDATVLAAKHEQMGRIFAAARTEHEAWVTAKMELDAMRAREAFDRAKLVGTVRHLKSGGPIEVVTPSTEPPLLPIGTPERLSRIKVMNELAEELHWPAPKRERLMRAFSELRGDGEESNSQEIRQVWNDILKRPSGELAQAASRVGYAGMPAAGVQTNPMDCTLLALSNATGQPYGVVAARAAVLLEGARWRSAADRAAPEHVMAREGLNGDEVIMLTESFGQAEIVRSENFPKVLAENRPILVDVVSRSGKIHEEHQVVLTKTFSHDGQTWYEMMNSSGDPAPRQYLSHKELEVVLIENGVAYRPEPGTVPELLRDADGS